MNGPAFRRSLTALSFVAAALLLVDTIAADETLRYRFTAGEKLSYQMEQKTVTTVSAAALPQAMKTTAEQSTNMVWDIKEVDSDGNAVIGQAIKRIKMNMAAPGGMGFEYDSDSKEEPTGPIATMIAPLLGAMTGATFNVKMSPRGEIIDLQVPEEVTAAMKNAPNAAQMGEIFTKEGFEKMVQQGSLVFPEGELKPATEWTRTLKMKNPALGGEQTIDTKYRYEGREEVDGKNLDKFNVEIKLDFGDGTGPAGAKLNIRSQGSEGTIYFDREAGRMHSASVKMAMDMDISASGNTMDMHLDQTITTKVAPVKE